jgi:catechol 2,3-dioxygenase-like lactoylglutathione lyase family enzyme
VTDHGVQDPELERLAARREQLAARYLKPREVRPEPTARGVHHVALICSDVERTVRFYDGLLGFPLIEMFENRDYRGSTHFFFDIGAGNTLAFFDLPGVEIGPYAEVFGGLQHLAISISQEEWEAARDRLDAAGIPYQHISGTSLYFLGPDGERLELLADPLRWMYGKSVG